jgi:hypothetical protein
MRGRVLDEYGGTHCHRIASRVTAAEVSAVCAPYGRRHGDEVVSQLASIDRSFMPG